MADFPTIVTMLNALENDSQRLSFILADVFDVNKINEEERFPVLIGTVSENLKKTAFRIKEITTLWGTKLTLNPYSWRDLSARMEKYTVVPTVGDRIVFVAAFGLTDYEANVLAESSFCSFAQLEVGNSSSHAELIQKLLNRKEFAKYRVEMTKLLKVKEQYVYTYETVESLQQKADDFSQRLDQLNERQKKIAPDGIEATTQRLDRLEQRVQTEIIDVIEKYIPGPGNIEDKVRNAQEKLDNIKQRMDLLAPDGIAKREKELDHLQERAESLSGIEKQVEEAQRKARFFLGLSSDTSEESDDLLLPSPESDPMREFASRVDYKYDRNLLASFLTALSTTQIITLFGEPGTGKTTFVSKIAKALGAKCSIISVQNNWTDSSDLLGYYSPIDKTYESTLFVEALIDANREWLQKGLSSRLHIICLDEMNLARVEYYFALFLGLLQLDVCDRWIRVLPKHIQQELDKLVDLQDASNQKEHLMLLREYADFRLPPNVRFVGTINSDDTTNFLSPKVIDRGYFIELSKDQHAPEQTVNEVNGYYPTSFFDIDSVSDSKDLNVFKTENNRFKDYAKEMLVMYRDRLKIGKATKPFCEQLIIAKILPALRRASDYSYDAKEYPDAFAAFEKHKFNSGDAYNYLGGNR